MFADVVSIVDLVVNVDLVVDGALDVSPTFVIHVDNSTRRAKQRTPSPHRERSRVVEKTEHRSRIGTAEPRLCPRPPLSMSTTRVALMSTAPTTTTRASTTTRAVRLTLSVCMWLRRRSAAWREVEVSQSVADSSVTLWR